MDDRRIPIIIDTDPGVDDFFCIAYGIAFPEVFDLKAITTIGGNNVTAVTTRNALDICKLLHSDAPVAAGHNSFLTAEFGEPVEIAHGKNGLGNVDIPHSDRKPMDKEACDVIYDIAKELNGELVLVPVGPLTNVALAIQKYPDITGLIKKITLMGGGVERGNVNEHAEANIWHDAEAAKIVFDSGIPIDMIGLDVTLKAPVSRADLAEMSQNTRDDVRVVMEQLIDFRRGEPMHDAVAIATLIDDSFITWGCGSIDIIVDDPVKKGKTVFTEGKGNHRAALKIDLPAYHRLFGEMVGRYTAEQ